MSKRRPPLTITDATMRRTCPACSRRINQQIAPDCPICAGLGYLVLGRAASLKYGFDVVSRAVEYALEAQAGEDLAAKRLDLAKARASLTAMVVKLAKVGLLHPGDLSDDEPNPVHAAVAHLQARALVERHSGLRYPEGAAALLAAPPVTYEPGMVPVDGTLPGFSRAGFLCNLARVCDPADPLEVHTPDSPQRRTLERQGDILGRAVAHR